MEHDDPNAKRLTQGKNSEIVWRFTKAGQFEFGCLIPGHREAGMTGTHCREMTRSNQMNVRKLILVSAFALAVVPAPRRAIRSTGKSPRSMNPRARSLSSMAR